MKSLTIKKLYNLHSWVGVITGVLLFVIAFTGAVSVFGRPELKIWSNTDIHSADKVAPVKIEAIVSEYAKKVPEAYKEEILIFLPRGRSFKNLSILFEAHSGIEEDNGPAVCKLFEFDPVTLMLISSKEGELRDLFGDRESDMADFIVDFHADLHLGRPFGLLLTGLLGLTLMASIVTGVIIHRKILPQLFTFRPHKSFSLMLNDGHKALGVWGLLFHSTIAFTGAFLGLAVVILVPAAAFVSFGGDQDKLIETFTAIPDPIVQNIPMPTNISSILTDSRELNEGVEVNSITIKGYGDASAMAYATVSGGEAIAPQTAVYDAQGNFVSRYSNFGKIEGFSGEILDLLFPLHFGNFGGIFVKVLWAVLGLSTAMLPLTGLMLWIERGTNAAIPRHSMKTYRRFNRFVVGACGGIVLACVALFPAQIILSQINAVSNVGNLLGWVFFPVWIASLFWAFILSDEKRVAKQMSLLASFTLILVMPMSIVSGHSQLTDIDNIQKIVPTMVNLTLSSLGIISLFLTIRTSTHRNQQHLALSIKEEV